MRRLWLSALVLVGTAMPVRAGALPAELRIGLLQRTLPHGVRLSADGPLLVTADGVSARLRPGAVLRVSAAGERLQLVWPDGHAQRVFEARAESPAPMRLAGEGAAFRRYAGRLRLSVRHGHVLPVLTLPLERYVAAVVASELPPDWPDAAYQAQAIAARSYAVALRGRHVSEGYDLCDLTHCEHFRGLEGLTHAAERAAADTAGEVLTYRGQPVPALWSACCAGERADNTLVFGGRPEPYLHGGPDRRPDGRSWCIDAPAAAGWTHEVSRPALARALRQAGLLGAGEPLAGLRVSDRQGAYAISVRLTGTQRRVVSAYSFWMAVGASCGWSTVPSLAFDLTPTSGAYRFKGRGLGHGVGLCQWGARARAQAGWSAARILAAYFPGTRIVRR